MHKPFLAPRQGVCYSSCRAFAYDWKLRSLMADVFGPYCTTGTQSAGSLRRIGVLLCSAGDNREEIQGRPHDQRHLQRHREARSRPLGGRGQPPRQLQAHLQRLLHAGAGRDLPAPRGQPLRRGPPADRGRPGQRQDAQAQGAAGRLHRPPLALPAREGPLRLDHAAGRRQRRRPAQARHRRHDRHRGRVRAARSACCPRTTASSRPRCSKT